MQDARPCHDIDAEVPARPDVCTRTPPAARPARDADLRGSNVDGSVYFFPQRRPWGPAGPAAVSLGEPGRAWASLGACGPRWPPVRARVGARRQPRRSMIT